MAVSTRESASLETAARPNELGPSLLLRALRGILAGALLAAAFPPYNLRILLPLGAAALLWALNGATLREGIYTGLACGAVYFGATLFWLFNLFGAASISLIAIAAAFLVVFSMLLVWLLARLPRVPVWFVSAVIWVSVEYFRSEPFTLNFGWMGLGYGTAGSQ